MKLYLFLLFMGLSMGTQAQFHEAVFPELEGNALQNALIDNYKTNIVLDYSEARDTFMRNIDAVNNTLECVYTGYTITLDPDLDPTTDAFSQNINTEHTYPRSKGAQEGSNAYSDMHHLFPTRVLANTDRGSLPFQENPDNQTDKWYLNDNVFTNVPSSNIDAYSEFITNEGFEPREAHKGDVARAYFYFYTMYKTQADAADSEFFELQRETMCDWTFADPVDEKEWNRNNKIAEYQDGKKNPFILDCRLARLYCSELGEACLLVDTKDKVVDNLHLFPNPVSQSFEIQDIEPTYERYTIKNLFGQSVKEGFVDQGNALYINTDNLALGMYIITLHDNKGIPQGVARFTKI